MNPAANIQEITQRLQTMRPEDVSEAKDFVAQRNAPASRRKRIVKLKGIWKGTGIEKLNIEKELRDVRSDLQERILKRRRSWTMRLRLS